MIYVKMLLFNYGTLYIKFESELEMASVDFHQF